MPQFEIQRFDNDYRAYVDSEFKYFKSMKEAREYADKKSWKGFMYLARERRNG